MNAQRPTLNAERPIVVPCRGDFFATDGAHHALKEARLCRDLSRRHDGGYGKIFRSDMRYYARAALAAARKYRAART